MEMDGHFMFLKMKMKVQKWEDMGVVASHIMGPHPLYIFFFIKI
jgi:hypothetical protein